MINAENIQPKVSNDIANYKPPQPDLPPFAANPIKSIKGAKKMLARLIHGFQRGEIESSNAKTLCYLLVSYCTIIKDSEFESRLKDINERLNTLKPEEVTR